MNAEAPTVVIVETDDSHRLVISSWLSSRGFRVITFGDTEVALFVAAGFRIDAVVLGADFAGVERSAATLAFIDALRATDPAILFVVLHDSSQHVERARLPETVVALDKPWCDTRLSNTIEALLFDRSGQAHFNS